MSKKGKFVDICTLEDLTALVNHNFQAFEKRVAKLDRKSKHVDRARRCRSCGRLRPGGGEPEAGGTGLPAFGPCEKAGV